MDSGDFTKSFGDLSDQFDVNGVNLDEVLNDSFIAANTKLKSFKEFVDESGFDIESILDYQSLPVDKMDDFVRKISQLGSWNNMLSLAFHGLASSMSDRFNLDEVLNDSFIAANTRLKSFKEFVDASGFDIESILDYKNLPADKMNKLVRNISQFGSWNEMLVMAYQKLANNHAK